jgi:hypothetical protein
MSNVEIVARTIRIPRYLADQLDGLAAVTRRSFTKQAEVILENFFDRAVESDLILLREPPTSCGKPSSPT